MNIPVITGSWGTFMKYISLPIVLVAVVTLARSMCASATDTVESPNNRMVVQSYVELLFKQHDLVAVEKLVSADAVYTQAAGLPYGGRYVGFEQWKQMFSKVNALVDIDVEGSPMLLANAAATRVMVQFNVRFRAKKSQQQIVMPVAEQFDLVDGKIVAVTPFYFDTKTFSAFLSSHS